MKPERWQQIKQLYQSALEREGGQRVAFLAEACADDDALRREVESLLGYAAHSGELLDQPALEVVAKVLVEEESDSPVGRQLGSYQVLTLLGRGGMGEVHLALDTRLNRKVAIKLLPAEFTADAERVRRFEQEARAASALNHPNIITIHEIGVSEGVHYLVTELVEGETLRARLQRGRLQVSEAIELALQVVGALGAAHAAGIVHRDIKPENVMVRQDGLVKVLDFGLAKLLNPEPPEVDAQAPTAAKLSTASGVVMGTVAYMSPEQARGLKVDARADIFSFGVLLYEMLAGRRPFEGQTVSDVLAAVLTSTPAPLSRHNSEVPPELERAVLKCLAKEREQRWQSAAALAAVLKLPDNSTTPVARGNFFKTRLGWLAITLLCLLLVTAFWWLRPTRTAAPAIRSLAVLPLENLSGDTAQEYFVDGMTEALISSLAQIRALRVVSRTSVMRFKGSRKPLQEIAQELNVDAVIEGSVQRADGRVMITTRLIQAPNDAQLWSQVYQRDLADVLKLQSEVARTVADEIRVQVTAEERARLAAARRVDPAAYEAYLLGRYHSQKRNEEDLKRAIEHFERAIQLAPDYAAAYAGLSDAWGQRGIWGAKPFKEAEAPAHAAALQALTLDPNLAEAHVSLGHQKYVYDWDWSGAEEEMKRALTLDPSSLTAHLYYANLLMALGRFPEAIAQIQSAAQLDPLSSTIQSDFGRILYRARKYDEAIERLKRALELDPANTGAYGRLGDVYTEMGRYEEAIAALEKAQSLPQNSSYYKTRLARIYVLVGRRQEALQIIEELKNITASDRFGGLAVASVYAALGNKDEAFRLLVKLVEERDQLSIFIKVDPPLDSLHSDPRWKKLLRRMNLPTE